MFIPEKMKLNKIQQCNLPTARDLFARVGYKTPIANQFSGDDLPPVTGNKVDNLALMEEYDKQRQNEEN